MNTTRRALATLCVSVFSLCFVAIASAQQRGQTNPQGPVPIVTAIASSGLQRAAIADGASSTERGKAQTSETTSAASAPVGPPPSAISVTGTQNKIAKWLDNAGTLGDSNIFEDAGGNIGVGTTDLTDILVTDNDKFKIVDGPMTFSFRDASTGQGYFAIGSTVNGIKGIVGHTNTVDGLTLGTFSNHKLTLRTNSINRLTIDTAGNVGIGTTTTPTAMLHVNGSVNFTGLRTEAAANTSNVIGGFSGNTVTAGVVGATIGGGGDLLVTAPDEGGTNLSNRVTDNFGTVGGGRANMAGDNAGTVNDSIFATVGGGTFNTASGPSSAISGGFGNTASGSRSIASGGSSNTASGRNSTVSGGMNNVAQGDFSFAAGNRARALHQGSFVWADSTTSSGSFFSSTANNQFLIKATGGVGIGTNAPAARFHVLGQGTTVGGITGENDVVGIFHQSFTSDNTAISVDAATGRDATLYFAENGSAIWGLRNDSSEGRKLQFRFHGGGANTSRLTLLPTGEVGIGTNNPAAKLDVRGTIRLNTLLAGTGVSMCRSAPSGIIVDCNASSARYKNDILSLRRGLDLMLRLRPVSFSWKSDGQRDIGLVAEEVNQVEPLLVTRNEQGEVEGVRYDRLGVVLLNAAQEQQAQALNQQAQIEKQQKMIEQLQAEVLQLRRDMKQRRASRRFRR